MKSISSRFLIAALAVLMGAAIARSQTADTPPPPPAHPHAHRMGGPGMEVFSRKLNLTDDQKTQMKAVMEKAHPTMKPLMQQQHQIDLQLRQYVQGTFDQAKVQALANQKAQIQAQLTVAETQVHNQMYQLLTPEQQSQLKEMEANHEARMQQHMNRMNEAPPAPPEQ
ncbi:MAG TPA: Spy/CpxP family protein refolding chaperone [Candidatus Binatia bacterium]|nr:Spy/CpxP family protein refolding chaperone [Candidatus Binatia bacterium]